MTEHKPPRPPDAEHLTVPQKRNRSTLADLVPSQPVSRHDTVTGDVCWRCGVPFAATTDEVLQRCAELARSAA